MKNPSKNKSVITEMKVSFAQKNVLYFKESIIYFKESTTFQIKVILQPIYCIDVNTHSGRNRKIM